MKKKLACDLTKYENLSDCFDTLKKRLKNVELISDSFKKAEKVLLSKNMNDLYKATQELMEKYYAR